MDRLTVHRARTETGPFITLALVGELDVISVGELSDAVVDASGATGDTC
ncbi:hypothetical protein [Streptomyces sp. NPDC048172]